MRRQLLLAGLIVLVGCADDAPPEEPKSAPIDWRCVDLYENDYERFLEAGCTDR